MGYLKKKIAVMITGGGAPGIAGTIFALRNNADGISFKIITTDINNDVVGKYLADEFYKVPAPESERYIRVLQEIVLREEVKVILPQTTREITVLSQSAKEFANLGAHIVVSSYESVIMANDKFLLLEKAKQVGVPYPSYYLTNSEASLVKAVELLSYPREKVVVKPRISNGMRGLRILSEDQCDVQRFLSEKPEGVEIRLSALLDILPRGDWPELLVTEYLPGSEYTADAFRGEYGKVIIPRLREKIRSGITFDAKVDLRPDIIEYSEKLAEALNLKFCFGFQFKLSQEGIPKLLECNPRVQGTMVFSVFAGFNIIYCSVMEALGKPARISDLNLKNGFKFKRYWGGIGISENGFIGKI